MARQFVRTLVPTGPGDRSAVALLVRRRRGVASVLAMMFLVIFGSLAAAMAVVAQGNLRTADSALKVSRAMSAAETGMVFATRRMSEESRRFIVREGEIDASFAEDLWLGTINPAEVDVLDPTGYTEGSAPEGIIQAIRNAHLADSHDILVDAGDADLPEIDDTYGVLRVRPIAISDETNAPFFRLRYELLDGEPMVRVTSEGVDGSVSRVLQMDFQIDKKIEYAILSTNRIMIGKNVMVEGPLGSRYGVVADELATANGDPLVMRSDFYFLDAALDAKLDTLYAQIVAADVDGDNRLRPDHPVEGAGLGALADLVDYDGNEYVDDFDLFLKHFDANSDGVVVYDAAAAAAAGLGVLSEELVDGGGDSLDHQLARLIDEARPDRDGDDEVTASDIGLGYRDGVVDGADLYAKVTGELAFAVARAPWETAHGESYQTVVEGSVRPAIDDSAVAFAVSDDELLEITTSMFDDSQSWFEAQVPGSVSSDPADLATLAIVAGTYTTPVGADWESVPFGSSGAYDYYQRPKYENMTFRNVRIAMGNNGLFENCTFVGVTYIESEKRCSHVDWNYAGAVESDGSPRFDPPLVAELPDATPVPDSRVMSNNIRFHNCTFLGSIAGDRLDEYTHWRNKIQMTGNTRFYIDPADADLQDQPDAATLEALLNGLSVNDRKELAKSSMLMPGWSVDVGNFNNETAVDPEDTPSVNLRGVIISGILDVRGTADVLGTLLMTFRPALGAGPLSYGGQPDAFNTTIGYFGPDDGDDEGIDPSAPDFPGFGEIRLRYNPDALLPDGIPWPVRMEAVPDTYVEGASS